VIEIDLRLGNIGLALRDRRLGRFQLGGGHREIGPRQAQLGLRILAALLRHHPLRRQKLETRGVALVLREPRTGPRHGRLAQSNVRPCRGEIGGCRRQFCLEWPALDDREQVALLDTIVEADLHFRDEARELRSDIDCDEGP
jgi:hypothetical protein